MTHNLLSLQALDFTLLVHTPPPDYVRSRPERTLHFLAVLYFSADTWTAPYKDTLVWEGIAPCLKTSKLDPVDPQTKVETWYVPSLSRKKSMIHITKVGTAATHRVFRACRVDKSSHRMLRERGLFHGVSPVAIHECRLFRNLPKYVAPQRHSTY